MINPHADSNSNKTCTKCGDSKPATIEYFYWNKHKNVYRKVCRICERKRVRDYTATHVQESRDRAKKWQENNTERVKAIKRNHYTANSGEIKKRSTLWIKNNIEKVHVLRNKRNKVRRRTEPKIALDERMSSAIRLSLKKGKGGRTWSEIVGYSVDDLKNHLEKQFKKGMTWEKFLNGEIHIDHKIPKSAFNYTKPEHEDFKKCWALKNLQPLWAVDNFNKHNKLTKHFQPSLLL